LKKLLLEEKITSSLFIMPTQSTNVCRWSDISKPVLFGCISGTVVASILWVMSRRKWDQKKIHHEKNIKLGWGGHIPDSNDVDLEAVHEFYKAVQESPLLYEYFMNVKTEKREAVMRNIACLFHKTLQKGYSPADSVRLRNIHKNLNITDEAYNKFTKLFAHICCKGKSDKLRARMLKSFAMLKGEICSTIGKPPVDLAGFFELLTGPRGSSRDFPWAGTKEKASIIGVLRNSHTVSHKVSFPPDSAQSLVLGRAKAWNNRSTHEILKKKIVELESKINRLANLNYALDERIKLMEPMTPVTVKHRKGQFFVTAG